MPEEGVVDEPGRETAEAGALPGLRDGTPLERQERPPLSERTQDDITPGAELFEPGRGPGKDGPGGRKCPPGKHWNANLKKCVQNKGGGEPAGRKCPPGKHWSAE